MVAKHPGFKAVQGEIAAKEGIGEAAAGAILASSTRKASAKAKRANPRLKRVKGKARSRPQPKGSYDYMQRGS